MVAISSRDGLRKISLPELPKLRLTTLQLSGLLLQLLLLDQGATNSIVDVARCHSRECRRLVNALMRQCQLRLVRRLPLGCRGFPSVCASERAL